MTFEPSLDNREYPSNKPKQYGYYKPSDRPGAATEARKPITKEAAALLSATVADDSLQQLKKITKLLEEQRALGLDLSFDLTCYVGGNRNLVDFGEGAGNQFNTYTSGGSKNLISIDFEEGTYSQVPANTPINVPYRKLYSLQIINNGTAGAAGGIRFNINRSPNDKQAMTYLTGNASYSHPYFTYPTIKRINVRADDLATADVSVQLIAVI